MKCLRPRAGKGKARSRGGRCGVPDLPRLSLDFMALEGRGACRRARFARPFGRVIPLRPAALALATPVSPTGRAAALRFNLSQWEKRP